MRQPAYRKAWNVMLHGEKNLPVWLGQITGKGNYVTAPQDDIEIDGVTYSLFNACKAHDCGGNSLEVLFAPGGTQAWAALVDNGPIRFFGKPTAAQAKVLAAPFSQ
jgi:hypothetical protein